MEKQTYPPTMADSTILLMTDSTTTSIPTPMRMTVDGSAQSHVSTDTASAREENETPLAATATSSLNHGLVLHTAAQQELFGLSVKTPQPPSVEDKTLQSSSSSCLSATSLSSTDPEEPENTSSNPPATTKVGETVSINYNNMNENINENPNDDSLHDASSSVPNKEVLLRGWNDAASSETTTDKDEEENTSSSSSSSWFTHSHNLIKKGAVAVAGGTMVGVGLVMIPLPTPFGAVIAGSGMAVLGTEFEAVQQTNQRMVNTMIQAIEEQQDQDENNNQEQDATSTTNDTNTTNSQNETTDHPKNDKSNQSPQSADDHWLLSAGSATSTSLTEHNDAQTPDYHDDDDEVPSASPRSDHNDDSHNNDTSATSPTTSTTTTDRWLAHSHKAWNGFLTKSVLPVLKTVQEHQQQQQQQPNESPQQHNGSPSSTNVVPSA